jgi:hypothetical protein
MGKASTGGNSQPLGRSNRQHSSVVVDNSSEDFEENSAENGVYSADA